MKLGASQIIDSLAYGYNANSNQLQYVTDAANDTTSTLGDFKEFNTGTAIDYAYDGNGNLNLDNNKRITSIAYNYLNLPIQVNIYHKGVISYTYDAGGSKLKKITVDSTTTPVKTTTTLYLGAFNYQNDTLQFISHEEGRIRTMLPNNAASLYYDYYEKDHLGNTRVVLTDQGQRVVYAATMELANAATEQLLFDSIASTRYPVPAGFEPTTGADTSNHYVSQLNGSSGVNQRVGPSIVLQVMAGDTLSASTYVWYNTPAVQPTSDPSLLNTLTNIFATSVTGIGGEYLSSQAPALSTAAIAGITSLLNNQSGYNINAPKAFLNWALLDEQFNYVTGGVTQCPVITSGQNKQVLIANLPTTVQKSGYLYVYVSNESPQNVFFDKLTVQHNSGPLQEENHYYPFGLTMAGTSVKAAGRVENKYKYNGNEVQHNEFNDGSGLETMDFNARMCDPQIGRFWQIDPLTEFMRRWSPYSFGFDNPVSFSDPSGMEGHDSTKLNPIPAPPGVVKKDDKGLYIDHGNVTVKGIRHKSSASVVRQAASWIPVIGFGLDSYDAFKDGHWLKGSLLALAAVGDALTLGEEGVAVHATEALVKHGMEEAAEHEFENGVVKAEEEVAEQVEQNLEKEVKEAELPSLDATGKVHGTLPKAEDLSKYSTEELQILYKELKQSVQQRIEVTSKLGRDRAHGQRQGAEQALIKSIEKYLKK